jgi:multisubunit Na+/H+ antiporter MnhG subunit
MVSELMPAMGIGLVDSAGNKAPINFWDFIDKRLWVLFIAATCLSGVVFHLIGDLRFLRDQDFFKQGLSAFKEDAISLLVTVGSVLLVIFIRKLSYGKCDVIALLGVILNYIIALAVFNSTTQDKLH